MAGRCASCVHHFSISYSIRSLFPVLQEHWFTIRAVEGGSWFNFNSIYPAPEVTCCLCNALYQWQGFTLPSLIRASKPGTWCLRCSRICAARSQVSKYRYALALHAWQMAPYGTYPAPHEQPEQHRPTVKAVARPYHLSPQVPVCTSHSGPCDPCALLAALLIGPVLCFHSHNTQVTS